MLGNDPLTPSSQPTYDESLRLGWALFWRGVGSFVILMFAGNLALLFLLPELSRTSPSLWVALAPLLFATLVSAFLIMPLLVVRRLVNASFRGFHLRFVRDPSASR
jgi:hypothetical protein